MSARPGGIGRQAPHAAEMSQPCRHRHRNLVGAYRLAQHLDRVAEMIQQGLQIPGRTRSGVVQQRRAARGSHAEGVSEGGLE